MMQLLNTPEHLELSTLLNLNVVYWHEADVRGRGGERPAFHDMSDWNCQGACGVARSSEECWCVMQPATFTD